AAPLAMAQFEDAGAPAAAESRPAPQAKVRSIEIEGASQAVEQEIRALLRTHAGAPYDLRDIQDDLEMITTRPGVERARWRTDSTPNGVRVIFEVVETGAAGEPPEAPAPTPEAKEAVPAGEIVRSVEVQGTKRTEVDVIELVIRTHVGDRLDREKLSEDVKRIFKTGFYEQVEVETEREGEGWRVIFEVRERKLIAKVNIDGPSDSDKDEIRGLLTLKPNTFLNPFQVEKNLQSIRKFYANKGYFAAKVKANVADLEDQRAEVTLDIDEGDELKIERIRFTGNRAFDDDELRGELQSSEDWFFGWITGAGEYKDDFLKADVFLLTSFYLNHGYFKVHVEPAEVTADSTGLYLTYKVTEGEQYYVESVDVAGLEDDPLLERIKGGLRLKAGDLFTRDALQQDIENITTFYSDVGYARISIDPDFNIDEESRRIAFTYKIVKGPKVYFDRIKITGNTKTRDKVIRRELYVQEQKLYSGSDLKRTKERLDALGYFSEVNINTTPVEGQPDRERVTVDVREGETGTLSGGAGFSSTDSFLFNVRVTNRNLFGRGQTASLSADIGRVRQDFFLRFTEPWLFDIPLSAGVEGFRTLRAFQDFDRESRGGSLTLSYPIWDRYRVRLGGSWRTEIVSIQNVDNNATFFIRSQEGTTLTNSFTTTLSQNTLNHPLDPTRGHSGRVSVELAGTVFGGDTDFIKVIADSRWFFPVVYGTTLSLHGRFSWAKGLQGDRLPIFERFFLGGIDSVRGYEVNSIGPEIDNDVIGGDKELLFNVEYIFPVIPQANLKGLVFLDAGNAFSEDENIDLTQLRMSVGFGFRWISPLGPLQLAIGFPIERRENEKSSAVQFSVGAPL
ncbi:MAG: outer membrane protein assembly factor BamA, partial [Myxococcales bacterium]|nr:outer membrane protein assembly factor BamA [Myxococcales bacterium]